jgi:hypothetical protein
MATDASDAVGALPDELLLDIFARLWDSVDLLRCAATCTRWLDDLSRPGIGLFSKHDGLFNYAKPLASRHGLLLARIMPAPLDYRKLYLAVCHVRNKPRRVELVLVY